MLSRQNSAARLGGPSATRVECLGERGQRVGHLGGGEHTPHGYLARFDPSQGGRLGALTGIGA
jgi:hypothetical protein